MRLITVASLISGTIASAIPSAANPFHPSNLIAQERRQVPETCESYVTVTVIPDVVTVTNTDYFTTTVETVTATEVSISQSTQDVTDVEIVTEFSTSFVTETITVATVTQTDVIYQRMKKRGRCVHQSPSPSSSYSSAAASTSSTPSSSTAPVSEVSSSSSPTSSAAVCTITLTEPAVSSTVTQTIIGSATATTTQTTTSLVIQTITTTVSSTDILTTTLPATLAVTASTTVTSTVPLATPTFILRAVGGTVDGQYLYTSTQSSYSNVVKFTPTLTSATSFYFTSQGTWGEVSNTAHVAYFDGTNGVNSYVLLTTDSYGTSQGGMTMTCELSGSTTIGSTGSFVCPNNGNAKSLFAVIDSYLGVESSSGPYTTITLQYTVTG